MNFILRKPTVRIYMAGGIGNQLFQAYAGIFLSLKFERELILDYRNIHEGFTDRVGRLEFLKLDSVPGLKVVWGNKVVNSLINLRIRIFRKISRFISNNKICQNSFITEIGYHNIHNLKDNQTLFGHFQSWRYVDFVESRIGPLQIKEQDNSQWFQMLISEIRIIKPIVIHFRCGDYINLTEKFGILSFEYFESALKKATQKTKSREVFIFSDEPKKASEVFVNIDGFNLTFINPPPESKDYESLILMGGSDILIISNSTFSWWSAYLNKTPIVYCPDKWFKNMNDPIDLIPANWNKVPSAWS